MTTPPRGESTGEITSVLRLASHGNKGAFDQLLTLVYPELNRLAHARLRAEPVGHTLNTTALVHEAYLKLVDQTQADWKNRNHFFAVASEAMRRILVDYAKHHRAKKRGGGAIPVDLAAADQASVFSDSQVDELLALDDALDRLAQFNPDGARVVEFRFFGGLANPEVAEIMGTSERTVRRVWTVARAWLRRDLGDRAGFLDPTPEGSG
ncbi:MAG: sigma-70 family RNA polymerase sigma factor [Gemmatimonadetes bacterium]|nr:sigma-70 family RNA polymerase sigma factor [Gemmatimonadota bacterium]